MKTKQFLAIGSSDSKVMVDLIEWLNDYEVKDPESTVIQVLDNRDPINETHVVWQDPFENEPEEGVEILAKDPNGVKHLTAWRPYYQIFHCQGKQDSLIGWKYTYI